MRDRRAERAESSSSGRRANGASEDTGDVARDVRGASGIQAVPQLCASRGPDLASTAARHNDGASASSGSLWRPSRLSSVLWHGSSVTGSEADEIRALACRPCP